MAPLHCGTQSKLLRWHKALHSLTPASLCSFTSPKPYLPSALWSTGLSEPGITKLSLNWGPMNSHPPAWSIHPSDWNALSSAQSAVSLTQPAVLGIREHVHLSLDPLSQPDRACPRLEHPSLPSVLGYFLSIFQI